MHKCTKAGCFMLRHASAALCRASPSTVGSSRSWAGSRPAKAPAFQIRQLETQLAPSHLADQISRYLGLNDEQRAAVLCDKQHIRLRAGPGSGKTLSAAAYACLAVQVADQQGTAGKVLAITFTNAAKNELEQRVKEKAPGVDVGERLHVTTIHSLCTEILGTYSKHPGGPGSFTIASEYTKQQFVADILRNSDQWNLDDLAESDLKYLVDKFVKKISAVKTHVERLHDTLGNLRCGDDLILLDMRAAGTDTVLDDVVTSQAPLKPDKFRPELVRVYDAYQQAMANRRLVDFDDLLHLTLRLLEQNPQVKGELRARYHTIIVDEAQDLNKCQHAILKELTDTMTATSMLGDPQQCIFQFTGSESDAWLGSTFSGQPVEEKFLSKNHRSTHPLVQLGDHVKTVTRQTCNGLSHVLEEVIPGQAVRADPADYDHAAKLMEFEKPQAEAEAVVALVQNNKPSDTIGILFTGKADTVTVIRESLTAAGISFTFEEDNAFLQSNEVKAADALLRVVIDPDNADLHLRSLIDLCQQEGWRLPLMKDLDGSTCTKLKELLVSSSGHDSSRKATVASQLYDNIDHARAADVAAMMLADVARQELYPLSDRLQRCLTTVGLIRDKDHRCLTRRGGLSDVEVDAIQRLWAFVSVIRTAANQKPTQAAVQLMLSASGLEAALASTFGDGPLAEDTSALDRLKHLEAYIAAGSDDQHSSDTSSTANALDGRSASGLDQLAQFHQHTMLNSRTGGRLDSGQVQMTTVHKAKGREWDVVILVDARSLWFNNGTPQREIQQKCNVLYTAVTRAKDRLYVTWNKAPRSKNKGGYKATQSAIAAAFVDNAVDGSGGMQDRATPYGGASVDGALRADGTQHSKQGFVGRASDSWQNGFRHLIEEVCNELSRSLIQGVEVVRLPRK